LITRCQNFSDQIENGYSHHTNGVVFRRLFIAFFARNRFWCQGLETVSNAWHSLAIKPDKMRERGGETRKKSQGEPAGEIESDRERGGTGRVNKRKEKES
jgi:hypothetical protein